MTHYAALERHVPSLAPYLGWWLDGLRLGDQARSQPRRIQRLRYDPTSGLTHEKQRKLRRGLAALVVPDAQWLSLSIKLPPVSRAEQARIVALDVADRTPFDPGATWLDWTTDGRVHLVQKTLLGAAFSDAAAKGVQIRWLLREGAPETDVIDLDPTPAHPFRAAVACSVIALALLVGLASWICLDLYAWSQERTELVQRIDQTRPLADEARALAGRLDRLQADTATDVPEVLLPERPEVHVLLDDLTAAIPDGTYLTNLTLESDGASMTGWSAAPEDLVRLLEAQSGFEQVRLQGPLIAGDDGFRFDLRLMWGRAQ